MESPINYDSKPLPYDTVKYTEGKTTAPPLNLRIVSAQKWVPDSLRQNCKICVRSFSLTVRKHHCRTCGDIICSRCSQKRHVNIASNPAFGKTYSSVRACLECIMTTSPTKISDSNLIIDTPPIEEDWRASRVISVDEPVELPLLLKTKAKEQDAQPWAKAPCTPEADVARAEAFELLGGLSALLSRDAFSSIVQRAAASTGCEIAAVGLMDTDKIVFPSKVGVIAAKELPREVTFCSHAIVSTQPLIVNDTLLDERFVNNPLVTGSSKIRFYASVPLVFTNPMSSSSSPVILGTLSVLDTKPKNIEFVETLQSLAAETMNLLMTQAKFFRPSLSGAAVESDKLVRFSSTEADKSRAIVAADSRASAVMSLLVSVTDTQSLLAAQQEAMLCTMSGHGKRISRIEDTVVRIEEKFDSVFNNTTTVA